VEGERPLPYFHRVIFNVGLCHAWDVDSRWGAGPNLEEGKVQTVAISIKGCRSEWRQDPHKGGQVTRLGTKFKGEKKRGVKRL